MKCTCGAELPDNAKFCGKCGHSVQVAVSAHCPRCNAEIRTGAGFCGKCGYQLTVQNCPFCGAGIQLGSKFCPNCGRTVRNAGLQSPKKLQWLEKIIDRGEKEIYGFIELVRNKFKHIVVKPDNFLGAEDNSYIHEGVIIDGKNPFQKDLPRYRKLLVIFAIIGICLICFGIFGNLMKNSLKQELRAELGEYRMIINVSDIWDFIANLVLGNEKGMRNIIQKYSGIIDLFSLEFSGEDITSFITPMLSEARSYMKQELGGGWFFLLVIVIGTLMLYPGIILTIVSGLLWFLSGGNQSDLKSSSLSIFYIGACCWVGLMIIMTIVGHISINSVDFSGIYDLF